MTSARQPQHCDHECVCGEFKMNPIFGSGVPCSRNHEGCRECINDTRSTHTSTLARKPQQEYIITEEQLNLLYHADAGVSPYEPNNPDDTFKYPIPEVKPILDAIRSSPHTSAPLSIEERCKQAGIIVKDMIIEFNKQHDAQVANAERERVLDAIDEWINSDDHLSLYKWEVREKIRSLRTQPEPQQGGRR